LNLWRECSFFPDDGQCSSRSCAIDECEEQEFLNVCHGHASGNIDSSLDGHNFQKWLEDGDPWTNDADVMNVGENMNYVDLMKNPERFTGYSGPSATRIWSAIYDENCFVNEDVDLVPSFNNPTEQCIEKRVFYRIISGLHSSITTHLTHDFSRDLSSQIFAPNIDRFFETVAKHPSRVHNMYLTYLMLLRAVSKALPTFYRFDYQNGQASQIQTLLHQLTDVTNTCPNTFDENVMFQGADALTMKSQFKNHFRNISVILDCVSCERCKLWGKLQINGVGTALKILFDVKQQQAEEMLHLERTELVALIHTFRRLSESLKWSNEMFKQYALRNAPHESSVGSENNVQFGGEKGADDESPSINAESHKLDHQHESEHNEQHRSDKWNEDDSSFAELENRESEIYMTPPPHHRAEILDHHPDTSQVHQSEPESHISEAEEIATAIPLIPELDSDLSQVLHSEETVENQVLDASIDAVAESEAKKYSDIRHTIHMAPPSEWVEGAPVPESDPLQHHKNDVGLAQEEAHHEQVLPPQEQSESNPEIVAHSIHHEEENHELLHHPNAGQYHHHGSEHEKHQNPERTPEEVHKLHHEEQHVEQQQEDRQGEQQQQQQQQKQQNDEHQHHNQHGGHHQSHDHQHNHHDHHHHHGMAGMDFGHGDFGMGGGEGHHHGGHNLPTEVRDLSSMTADSWAPPDPEGFDLFLAYVNEYWRIAKVGAVDFYFGLLVPALRENSEVYSGLAIISPIFLLFVLALKRQPDAMAPFDDPVARPTSLRHTNSGGSKGGLTPTSRPVKSDQSFAPTPAFLKAGASNNSSQQQLPTTSSTPDIKKPNPKETPTPSSGITRNRHAPAYPPVSGPTDPSLPLAPSAPKATSNPLPLFPPITGSQPSGANNTPTRPPFPTKSPSKPTSTSAVGAPVAGSEPVGEPKPRRSSHKADISDEMASTASSSSQPPAAAAAAAAASSSASSSTMAFTPGSGPPLPGLRGNAPKGVAAPRPRRAIPIPEPLKK
jgi:ERO1-like protein alpha